MFTLGSPAATTLCEAHVQPAGSAAFERDPSRAPEPAWTSSLLFASCCALLCLVAVASPASAADTDIRINEVESNGGTPGDRVELTNVSDSPIDISGWHDQGQRGHPDLRGPGGTTVPAGGFVAVDVDVTGGFGLGADDSARVYLPDGTTLIDSTLVGRPRGDDLRPLPRRHRRRSDHARRRPGRREQLRGRRPTVRFNEVESNGDPVGDWVELLNTGATPVDISG